VENTTNFWSIIKDFRIEIPIIQRDYAQGRNTPKINEIRKKIIENIFESLTENVLLEFDFIYGNKKINGSYNKFIPLDGQQRLTTLFLLHWYIAFKEKKIEDAKILEGFTYETRISSREFCNALVKNISEFSIDSKESLREIICNQPWYYLSWSKDPTIKSMLQTLNDIHERFNNIPPVWDVLINNDKCPIVFRFIELEHFGLEDDLYIKMNARGKALTDFENFKAKFEQLLEQEYKKDKRYFEEKIDGTWTDLFWYPPQNADFDNKYLNFFKYVAKNNFALKMDPATKTKNKFAAVADSISSLIALFDENVIRDIKILDYFTNASGVLTDEYDSFRFKLNEVFEKIINDTSTYADSIMFYALSRFILENCEKPKVLNKYELDTWMRIIYNLMTNTEYDEEIEFARSIKMIDIMVPYSSFILNYFAQPTTSISGFNIVQIEEERIKAILINKSKIWESLLVKYENHGYFKGQIIFLLSFSGIQKYYKTDSKLNWNEEDDAKYRKKFINYATKLVQIFSDKGLAIKDSVWERALLTKGFYPIGKNRKYNLLKDLDRDYSWKRLLRDNEKNGVVKEVLDNVKDETLQSDLIEIIRNSNVVELRKYFIDKPKLIEACRSRYFQLYDDTYLLLKTSITAGYHKELRSYNLFLMLNELCSADKNHYEDNKGIESIKAITIVNGHETEIYYKEGQFIMTVPQEKKFLNEAAVILWLQQNNILD